MGSPIQSIALEALSLIFIECLPSESAPPRVNEAPLLLGRVCRSWRELANLTPQLWTDVHVLITEEQPKVNKAALSIWLERSASAPLEIALIDTITTPGEFWDVEDALALLAPHCKRWRSLRCELNIPHVQRVLSAPERFGGLPMLEHFVLDNPPTNQSEDLSPPSLNLSLCPKLSFVTFVYQGTLAINEDDLPYALETVEDEYETSVADCFRLIQHAPRLKTLNANCTSISPFRSPETRVVQSALARLDLHMSASDQSIDDFLDNIDLPSLQYLGFAATRQDDDDDDDDENTPPPEAPTIRWTQSLPRFLHRSCPDLVTLHIDGFTTDHILQCIRHTHKLGTLYARLDATNDVLEALTCRNPPDDSGAGTDVVPLIAGLDFKCTTQAQTSLPSLTKMIVSRWGGPSGLFPAKGRLKYVNILGDVFESKDSFGPELKRCCDEGLHMNVMFG